MRMQLYIGLSVRELHKPGQAWKPETIIKQAQSPAFLCLACKCSWVSDCCDSMGWEEGSIWAWIFEYRTVILPMLMSVPLNISRCTLRNSLKNEKQSYEMQNKLKPEEKSAKSASLMWSLAKKKYVRQP